MRVALQVAVALLTLAPVVAPEPVRALESAGNGVYGGYVGSDRWFSSMRHSAANRAMLERLSGPRKKGEPVPAGYLEISGRIIFPSGNPFGKRFPDLRIRALDGAADPVLRSPELDAEGNFYAVVKSGVNYEVYWLGYLGGTERFGTFRLDANGPKRRKLALEYRPAVTEQGAKPAAAPKPEKARPEGEADQVAPAGSRLTSDGGYQGPQSEGGYRSPQSDGGYRSPQSDGGYLSPR